MQTCKELYFLQLKLLKISSENMSNNTDDTREGKAFKKLMSDFSGLLDEIIKHENNKSIKG